QEWVVISSHRDKRPWLGETVGDVRPMLPEFDPTCYLCPGNTRVSGAKNPDYTDVFAFDNDHPCVGPAAPAELEPPSGIYRSRPANGLSRVVCFSPRHDLTLAELSHDDIVRLLQLLQTQYRELAARDEVRHVLMFENKGDVVGVSNPHPHCQIYATNFVFKTIEVELAASAAHFAEHGRVLFQDIIAAEEADGRRLLARRNEALSFVPFFARYPYETYVAPRATHPSVADLEPSELNDFAAALRETLVRLENLWRMPLPYVMVFHQAPTGSPTNDNFHFHIQIHPPLRKPGLLKYLAGPEIGGGNFLNDTAPEEKAADLQAVSAIHYKQVGKNV
ncbi:MAG TPA: galactose-1-phosphate uridylyltransferase, partial [Gemmatimonadaceae bacterium]|nr:galactose-1-phosphate uridylyltransferase [Gemmatimonadaceae bacterium]